MRHLSLFLLVGLTGCLAPWQLVLPPEERTTTPAVGANQFALDLYAKLATTEGNLFCSPSCIREALAMAHTGARGETASEMAGVLHLPNDPMLARREVTSLRPNVGLFSGVTLRQAASVWGQRGVGIQRSFLGFLNEGYAASVYETDFTAGDSARRTINAWVERQTANHIRDLFPPGSLDADTRLALASAIYFKGDWVHPFKKERTDVDTFHVSRTQTERVSLMNQTEEFSYTEGEGCQVLQMPYVGKEIALLAVLPREVDGLPALEKSLTAEKLATWTTSLVRRKVHVTFPRFEMTRGYNLVETLRTLGMPKAFGPEADFSSINGGKEPLCITTVIHQARIELNELGTEATAGTGFGINRYTAAPTPRAVIPVFRADHPFVFAIRDLRTGLILFLGRYARE